MANKPNIYVTEKKTKHTRYNSPYMSDKCDTCMNNDKEMCEKCQKKYIVSIWINDYVYKEKNITTRNYLTVARIINKYNKEDSIDFFNIYVGINEAIKNYIDGFGPQPEFILTNEKIKNKKQLNDIINKYKANWYNVNNPDYLKLCINILENLYYNKRILHTSVPEDDVEVKFFTTKEEFNKYLKQDNDRRWGLFKRSVRNATSF